MTLRPLPQPATAAECYLAAVVDRLDQINAAVQELAGRLGPSTQPAASPDEEGTVRLLEPDTPRPSTRQPLREPDVQEPPRYGKGSGRPVWAGYADRLGITYPPEAGQRDIVAAVDAAKQAAA